MGHHLLPNLKRLICLILFLTGGLAHVESLHASEIASGPVTWSFNTEETLALESLTYQDTNLTHILIHHQPPRPLFDLTLQAVLPADAQMNAQGGYDWQNVGEKLNLRVTAVERADNPCRETLIFTLTAESQAGPIAGNVRVQAQANGDLLFAPHFGSTDKSHYLKLTLRGPILEEIDLGPDSWYFFPRGRGIFNDQPCLLSSSYGQYVWMQSMGCYGKETSLLLSMIPQENQSQPKGFLTHKAGPDQDRVIDKSYDNPLHEDLRNQTGITQTLWWPDWTPDLGKMSSFGPIALRIRRSQDWRDIYRHYQEYRQTWWQEKPQNRRWVRHHYSHGSAHPYVANTVQEFIDWSLPVHDATEMIIAKPMNLCCYLDYSLVGPDNPEGIHQIITGRHQKGVRSTVYVHGKAVSPQDKFFQEEARACSLAAPINGEGEGGPPGTGGDGLCWMNLNTDGWRNWLAKVTTDLLRQIGADAIRLDCIGYAMRGGGNGANPLVDTPPTRHDNQVKPSVETVAHVRRAMDQVNPAAALGAENLGSDTMMNVMDYSLSYNIWEGMWTPENVYPSPVSYIRFVFPDFKFLEICGEVDYEGNIQPSYRPIAKAGRFNQVETIYREALNQVLFNGVGHAGWNRAANHMDIFETMRRIQWENTHCFEGANVIPEIPTLQPGVYANYFGADDDPFGPRVITLMNWTREPIEGPLIELDLKDGERVFELVALNELHLDNGRIVSRIEPMRTIVLRIVPGQINVWRGYGSPPAAKEIGIRWPNVLTPGQKVIAYLIDADGNHQPIDLSLAGGRSAGAVNVDPQAKLVVQLMNLHDRDAVKDYYVIEDMAAFP